jgi:hypothetical protein
MNMTTAYLHKLKPDELARFLSADTVKMIVDRSMKRKPGKFDHNPVKVYLNKPKTIWVQSIHYYGGENFGEPYCFVAEITHRTTQSAFRRWINRCPLPEVFTRIPSTY